MEVVQLLSHRKGTNGKDRQRIVKVQSTSRKRSLTNNPHHLLHRPGGMGQTLKTNEPLDNISTSPSGQEINMVMDNPEEDATGILQFVASNGQTPQYRIHATK